MRNCLIITAFVGLLLAAPAWAGQRLCASSTSENRATFELPGRKKNTLLIKGDPTARFLIRFEWICRKGHIYREVDHKIIKIPLGDCFQPGKMHVTVRKGCAVFEIHSERSLGRGGRR